MHCGVDSEIASGDEQDDELEAMHSEGEHDQDDELDAMYADEASVLQCREDACTESYSDE